VVSKSDREVCSVSYHMKTHANMNIGANENEFKLISSLNLLINCCNIDKV